MTRESEFEDGDLERLLAFLAYQRGVCDCGVHESLASDKANVFAIDVRTCNVCKGMAQYLRVLEADDRTAADRMKDAPPSTPRPSDGRRIGARQLSPLEVAERRRVRTGGGATAT